MKRQVRCREWVRLQLPSLEATDARMETGEGFEMTEQANAPRAWMRWAIALALISGSVAASVRSFDCSSSSVTQSKASTPRVAMELEIG